MKISKCIVTFIIVLTFFTACLSSRAAAATGGTVKKVAVLPFNMHTPSQLSYLQDGIRDMLTSRLSRQGQVQVFDKSVINQATAGIKSDISLNDALRIGKNLHADYVLFGSVTSMGQAVSIDAKMAPVAGDREPVNLFAQTKTLDEVIPKINLFAQEINQKVFGRGPDPGLASAGDEGSSTRNPELLLPDSMASSDRISYLNPNFLEITPEGSLGQPGLWRSQTFAGGILGMDLGDVDGDKQIEIVTITPNKVFVHRREANGLRLLATHAGHIMDSFVWVSVVDTNRDGIAEIYVTNFRRANTTRPPTGNSILEDQGFTEGISSFGLTLANNKLQPTANRIPYFLNGIDFPGRGKVLLGQKRGVLTEGPFDSDILEIQMIGASLNPGSPVSLPARCNVFNFARADINRDNSDETILIDRQNALVILSASGEQLWKSDKLFSATTNTFEGKVIDRRYNQVELYAIPSPIIVTDLNKDGIPEIVLNRNTDTSGRFMPSSMQYFDRGEIISLSWDNMGLVENWKTREISGMVTSLRVGDLSNDGTPELVASLVLARDFLKLWEAKSTVFSYDLNISRAQSVSKKP
ncbi:MAG: FG-GAP-like repeat-containing protein [Syntrophobacteraceae bacterium]|nr:FG-GAP-like repeat-containing protein [Syntrophobacteraceae bacterium]